MAICNIFKELTNTNGTFLTFSQYLEDITRQQTLSTNYRVIPSRFIALDINPNKHDLDSINIPQYIQNYYENSCACWRNEKGNNWNPIYSAYLFWSMFLSKFVTREDPNDQNSNIPDIKYIGNINMFSYDEIDGMGYSEIYCHIPNEACVENIKIRPEGEIAYLNSEHVGDHIKGYTQEELVNAGLPTDWGSLKFDNPNTIYPLQSHIIEETAISVDDMPRSFNINTIIVLYDIYKEKELLYSDIPMGIYFTGLVNTDESNLKYIGNSITKYISNDAIYGSGTSYGIRICSKYVATADNITIKEIETKSEYQAEMVQLLSKMSESMNKMDNILDRINNDNQEYKDHLAIFKNDRTNVPYVKKIGEDEWWFVNGKPITKVQYIQERYDLDEEIVKGWIKDELDDMNNSLDGIYVKLNNALTDNEINFLFDGLVGLNNINNIYGES